jgi:hypothetical protein
MSSAVNENIPFGILIRPDAIPAAPDVNKLTL